MVNLWLASCMLVAPVGACKAEIEGDYLPPIPAEYPTWATEWCITHIAHIVASEARGVPSADLAVACTVWRDITYWGYTCFTITPDRWKGYGTPDKLDYEAVYTALSGGCDHIPVFSYLGNLNDARWFYSHNLVITQPLSLWLGPTDSAVVGIP